MSPTALSAEERDIIEHMLGHNYEPCHDRNYFATYDCSADYKRLRALESRGLVEAYQSSPANEYGVMWYFRATPLGIAEFMAEQSLANVAEALATKPDPTPSEDEWSKELDNAEAMSVLRCAAEDYDAKRGGAAVFNLTASEALARIRAYRKALRAENQRLTKPSEDVEEARCVYCHCLPSEPTYGDGMDGPIGRCACECHRCPSPSPDDTSALSQPSREALLEAARALRITVCNGCGECCEDCPHFDAVIALNAAITQATTPTSEEE